MRTALVTGGRSGIGSDFSYVADVSDRAQADAALAFLISEEAGYITGQILGVNGGRTT